MMKFFVFCFWICLVYIPQICLAQSTELKQVRLYYSQAVVNKELCLYMIKNLEKDAEDPVNQGYLGGYQTIWAKHTFNPMAKLKTFKEGRTNIDQAIKKSPKHIELRFIRLSVQKNAPGFLGYKNQIAEDQRFLKEHLHLVNSSQLKTYIEDILK